MLFLPKREITDKINANKLRGSEFDFYGGLSGMHLMSDYLFLLQMIHDM